MWIPKPHLHRFDTNETFLLVIFDGCDENQHKKATTRLWSTLATVFIHESHESSLYDASNRRAMYAGRFTCSHDGACGRQKYKLMQQRRGRRGPVRLRS